MHASRAVRGKLGPQQFFLSSSSAQVLHSGTNESKMELVEAWFISSSAPLLLAQVNGFYGTSGIDELFRGMQLVGGMMK